MHTPHVWPVLCIDPGPCQVLTTHQSRSHIPGVCCEIRDLALWHRAAKKLSGKDATHLRNFDKDSSEKQETRKYGLRMTVRRKMSWSAFFQRFSKLLRAASHILGSRVESQNLWYKITRVTNTTSSRAQLLCVAFAAMARGSRCCLTLFT